MDDSLKNRLLQKVRSMFGEGEGKDEWNLYINRKWFDVRVVGIKETTLTLCIGGELTEGTVQFDVDIVELPRLIAILNEIFRIYSEKTLRFLELREELVTGDNEENIATLRAYKVVADLMSDHALKLGLLAPIE